MKKIFICFLCCFTFYAVFGIHDVFAQSESVIEETQETGGQQTEDGGDISFDSEDLDSFEEDRLSEKEADDLMNGRIIRPHRIFEMGFSSGFDFSNNYFNADEILVKNLVIDLRKMADNMPEKGFSLNMNLRPDFFFNLNLKNGVHVGGSSGMETYGALNVSKELFEFLGKGNSLNETLEFDGGMNADVFMYMNMAVGLELFGFHIELVPAVYLPLVHAQSENVRSSFSNGSDGSVHASASADVYLYTFTDMKQFFDGNIDTNKIVESMKEGWGFDIESSIERRIFDSLTGQLYSRLPVVPGQLNYSTKMTMKASVDIDKITDIVNGADNAVKKDFSISDRVYSSASYDLHRPLKIGTEVAWRPFGKWCTFGGLLGVGVKEPFSANAYAYAEYKLAVDIDLFLKNWNLLGLKLSSSYLNEVFCHTAGFCLNLRAFEIDAGISAVGGSFAYSFKGSGIGSYLMIALGW